ncbi:MAG: hypothetical protein GWN00_28230, partial [Aliifodinibius sp.]|nr:hypothetical protein [Fodinibius sp.]NIV13468.1 hypothetical protein [Fodinibius sp.]NIY28550.1 hypothetical protein [Fodinibius sp.]
ITFITEEIPQTEQYQRPPAPDTPIIPAESEDPDLPDYIPDWDSEIDEDDAIVSPPLDGNVEEPEVPFFKLTEEPKVISRVLP